MRAMTAMILVLIIIILVRFIFARYVPEKDAKLSELQAICVNMIVSVGVFHSFCLKSHSCGIKHVYESYSRF
jgi:hypothetical protein